MPAIKHEKTGQLNTTQYPQIIVFIPDNSPTSPFLWVVRTIPSHGLFEKVVGSDTSWWSTCKHRSSAPMQAWVPHLGPRGPRGPRARRVDDFTRMGTVQAPKVGNGWHIRFSASKQMRVRSLNVLNRSCLKFWRPCLPSSILFNVKGLNFS